MTTGTIVELSFDELDAVDGGMGAARIVAKVARVDLLVTAAKAAYNAAYAAGEWFGSL